MLSEDQDVEAAGPAARFQLLIAGSALLAFPASRFCEAPATLFCAYGALEPAVSRGCLGRLPPQPDLPSETKLVGSRRQWLSSGRAETQPGNH
jgi:hypothetical protein